MPRKSAYDVHRWQVIKLLRDIADAPTQDRREMVIEYAELVDKSVRTVYAWLEKARADGTPLRDLVEVPEGPETGHDCDDCGSPAHLIGPGKQYHCDACFDVISARQRVKLPVKVMEDRNAIALAAIEKYESTVGSWE